MNKKEISLVVGALTLAASAFAGAISWVDQRIQVHEQHPHVQAVTEREFRAFAEQVLDRLGRIEESLRQAKSQRR